MYSSFFCFFSFCRILFRLPLVLIFFPNKNLHLPHLSLFISQTLVDVSFKYLTLKKKTKTPSGSCEADRLVYCILCAIHQSQGSCKRGFHCFGCFPHFCFPLPWAFHKHYSAISFNVQSISTRVLMTFKRYFLLDSWSYF